MFSATDGWGISEENGHLLRTGDGGSTWSDVTPTIPAQTYAAFFFDTRTAWVTSGNYAQPGSGKVFRTQDGGITWQNFPAPFTQGDITFINPDIGYAVADPICGAGSCVVRLYKTSDSGQSWSLLAINSPNGFENLPPSFPAGSIHIGSGDGFSFQNKNTIWFGGGGIATSQTAWLKVSRDEGKSWQEVRLPLPEQKPFSGGPVTMGLPQFITDQYGVFNAVYEGIGTGDPLVMAFYSSEDGGLTWKINPGLLRESSSWYRFDVFSIRGVAAQCGEVLCVSRDGLKTWQATPQSEKLNSTSDNIRLTFDFINSELGWTTAVRTDGGWTLYQTSDGGLTWVDKKPRIVALGH
jgi:photosystem II stability/assembly factor-like uncharacterized protein